MSAPSWAVPGRKVVCVAGSSREGWPGEIKPKIGEIYTIREVVVYPDGNSLRLVEIQNPRMLYREGLVEMTFRIERFRPLVTQEEDVAMFLTLLSPSGSVTPHNQFEEVGA